MKFCKMFCIFLVGSIKIAAMNHRPVSKVELGLIKNVMTCCFVFTQKTYKSFENYQPCLDDCNQFKQKLSASSCCCLCRCFQEKDELTQ